MAPKEKTNQIKITLPLIALCLPLFANHYVTAENGCPYETYLRVDNKCVDISQKGLNKITKKLDKNSVQEVTQEIEEVTQELQDLSEELNEFCVTEEPKTLGQVEIMDDVCQY